MQNRFISAKQSDTIGIHFNKQACKLFHLITMIIHKECKDLRRRRKRAGSEMKININMRDHFIQLTLAFFLACLALPVMAIQMIKFRPRFAVTLINLLLFICINLPFAQVQCKLILNNLPPQTEPIESSGHTLMQNYNLLRSFNQSQDINYVNSLNNNNNTTNRLQIPIATPTQSYLKQKKPDYM